MLTVSIEEEQQESNADFEELSEQEKHLQKHRELFLSRQVETVPATHIRGKCSVTLLNETEHAKSYLRRHVSQTVHCHLAKSLNHLRFV